MKRDLNGDHHQDNYLDVVVLKKDGELEENHIKDDSELEKDNSFDKVEGWRQP